MYIYISPVLWSVVWVTTLLGGSKLWEVFLLLTSECREDCCITLCLKLLTRDSNSASWRSNVSLLFAQLDTDMYNKYIYTTTVKALLFTHVCICTYVYANTHTHTHTHNTDCSCMKSVCVYMFACVCMCMHMCYNMNIWPCMLHVYSYKVLNFCDQIYFYDIEENRTAVLHTGDNTL